jgi:hypothetical protein
MGRPYRARGCAARGNCRPGRCIGFPPSLPLKAEHRRSRQILSEASKVTTTWFLIRERPWVQAILNRAGPVGIQGSRFFLGLGSWQGSGTFLTEFPGFRCLSGFYGFVYFSGRLSLIFFPFSVFALLLYFYFTFRVLFLKSEYFQILNYFKIWIFLNLNIFEIWKRNSDLNKKKKKKTK